MIYTIIIDINNEKRCRKNAKRTNRAKNTGNAIPENTASVSEFMCYPPPRLFSLSHHPYMSDDTPSTVDNKQGETGKARKDSKSHPRKQRKTGNKQLGVFFLLF